MEDKKIKMLRTFFKVSTAAFEMQQKIIDAFGGVSIPSNMHMLHKLAKLETEKEKPSLTAIDELLSQMEHEAERIKASKNNFYCEWVMDSDGIHKRDTQCAVCKDYEY